MTAVYENNLWLLPSVHLQSTFRMCALMKRLPHYAIIYRESFVRRNSFRAAARDACLLECMLFDIMTFILSLSHAQRKGLSSVQCSHKVSGKWPIFVLLIWSWKAITVRLKWRHSAFIWGHLRPHQMNCVGCITCLIFQHTFHLGLFHWQKIFPIKTADSEVCGLSRVTGALLQERHAAAEFHECCFSMLWVPQIKFLCIKGESDSTKNRYLRLQHITPKLSA